MDAHYLRDYKLVTQQTASIAIIILITRNITFTFFFCLKFCNVCFSVVLKEWKFVGLLV